MFSANAKSYTVFIILCMPFLCWRVSDRWNWDVCAILFPTFSILKSSHVCLSRCLHRLDPISVAACCPSCYIIIYFFGPLGWTFVSLSSFQMVVLKVASERLYVPFSSFVHTCTTHTDTHIQLREQSPKHSQGCITQKVERLRNEV